MHAISWQNMGVLPLPRNKRTKFLFSEFANDMKRIWAFVILQTNLFALHIFNGIEIAMKLFEINHVHTVRWYTHASCWQAVREFTLGHDYRERESNNRPMKFDDGDLQKTTIS